MTSPAKPTAKEKYFIDINNIYYITAINFILPSLWVSKPETKFAEYLRDTHSLFIKQVKSKYLKTKYF